MEEQQSLRLKVALAWMFVALPLIWGVSQTILKSLALFN